MVEKKAVNPLLCLIRDSSETESAVPIILVFCQTHSMWAYAIDMQRVSVQNKASNIKDIKYRIEARHDQMSRA